MERLITEIPVAADALFGGGLTVIVQEAKRAKDWDKFTKAAGHAGLKKITAISSWTIVVRLGREEGPGFDDQTLLRGKIRRGTGRTSRVPLPLRRPFGVGEDGLFEAVGAVEGVVDVPPPSRSRPDRQK